MNANAGVVQVNASLIDYENMLRQAIMEKLDTDKDALKALSVDFYRAKTVEEAQTLKLLGRRMFNVSGFLALDDSGGGKVFEFQVEEGLSSEADKEVAEKCAFQCLQCVAQMRREAGLSVKHITKKVHKT